MATSVVCVALLCILVHAAGAQEVDGGVPTQATCYGAGSIALSVVLTLILGAALALLGVFLWHKFYKARKGQHLILETDPEKGGTDYAFDNPGFRDAGLTPIGKSGEKPTTLAGVKLETNIKTKWNQWSPLGVLSGGGGGAKNEKKRTLDDSELENQIRNVSLQSHDFTGLGFNICGNMKEGIYIKDILHRGPASESKQLNVGDRIQSVTISLEHMVYEDALAILSYASPYDIVVSAKNGKACNYGGQVGRPLHPVYRSSSTMDLNHMEKTAKKRLFEDSSDSNYSSLPKNRHSTIPTLERSRSKSPKPSNTKITSTPKPKIDQHPVEYKEHLRMKTVHKVDVETQNAAPTTIENKVHKLGIQVLPALDATKLGAENVNNINHEQDRVVAPIMSIDEVDERKQPPPVKKREKLQQKQILNADEDQLERQNSGIRRDANNIPLEIPSTMLNAAVMARKNRKSIEEDDLKMSPKKKGKAPAPPTGEEDEEGDSKAYNSDSDAETDNQSSVNTIELNASDITIHQSEENADEKQNRKTASTGDLSKMQKTRKTSTGTLERAQSLDITDTGMPVLAAKKRKAVKIEDFESKTSSDESLYGSALVNKEPRLSLILDGLNTFQRSRLKKSTEWGNLEDAILNVDKQCSDNSSINQTSSQEDFKLSNEHLAKSFNFGTKSPEFDALVHKINEIKQETMDIISEQEKNIKDTEIAKKEISHIIETVDVEDDMQPDILKKTSGYSVSLEDETMPQIIQAMEKFDFDSDTTPTNTPSKKAKNIIWPEEEMDDFEEVLKSEPVIVKEKEKEKEEPAFSLEEVSDFLQAERNASERYTPESVDTNIPDDIKVSRHTDKNVNVHITNISNITINHQPKFATDDEIYKGFSITTPDLIKNLAIAEAIHDANNEVTIEGPTSLTLEIPDTSSTSSPLLSSDDNKIEIMQQNGLKTNGDVTKMEVYAADDNDNHHSLTYITEIQVTQTPPSKTNNISEIEIIPQLTSDDQLDNDFEQYIKKFESNIKTFENNIHNFEANIQSVAETIKSPEPANNNVKSLSITQMIDEDDVPPPPDVVDPEKELQKVHEIVEEQLKKLPEMRFTTSSYESQLRPAEKRQSQIELLRSNFERSAGTAPSPSPPRHARSETSPPKSRIPILNKTPPMSPERRDSRNLDNEQETKDILEMMASKIPASNKSKNVTVTSIRNNSRLPSGLPTYGSRPPVPPKKSDGGGDDLANGNNNGGVENFRQWVFNPNDQSVTHLTVADAKYEHK